MRQQGEDFPLARGSWLISAGFGAGRSGLAANSSMSRRATAGSSHASPATTARISMRSER